MSFIIRLILCVIAHSFTNYTVFLSALERGTFLAAAVWGGQSAVATCVFGGGAKNSGG